MRYALIVIFLASTMLSIPARAQDIKWPDLPAGPASEVDSFGGDAIPALPLEVMESNGITYINGGVGDEELAQLKAQKDDYNLQVELSAPGGAFISDVKLQILDEAGNVLVDVTDAGPYFYAKLPPGNYQLSSTNIGEQAQYLPITVKPRGSVYRHIVYKQ